MTKNHIMSKNRYAPAAALFLFLTALLTNLINTPVLAMENADISQQCMLDLLRNGRADMTVGEVRQKCAKESAVEADMQPATGVTEKAGTGSASSRIASDRKVVTSPFSILAHKPNYFLLGAYNFKGWNPALYREATNNPGYENKKLEGQFQLSLKVPLALDLFGDRMDIYGAYTNRSFWQMYNREYSEPFRETNHEPEVWLQFDNDWQALGLTNVVNTVGWVHQSNGRGGVLSRSWDRLYANFIFEKDNLVLSFKPWIWLIQDKTESDNPDITDYLGHGEFRAALSHKGHVYSMMLRNQLESGFDRGAIELGWSLPVLNYPYLKAYIQYFYGYGESLIDYDHKVNRIGVGIALTDWIK